VRAAVPGGLVLVTGLHTGEVPIYRVRYCAAGMDAARERHTRSIDQLELDGYLLQLWPAQSAPDRILRQTSSIAA